MVKGGISNTNSNDNKIYSGDISKRLCNDT